MRILINNEEVLCDSTLEITEQMLSTSSTILKNCYPASWELTKDYTSNYYFPEDYSKVEITDDENKYPIYSGFSIMGYYEEFNIIYYYYR